MSRARDDSWLGSSVVENCRPAASLAYPEMDSEESDGEEEWGDDVGDGEGNADHEELEAPHLGSVTSGKLKVPASAKSKTTAGECQE